MKLVTDPIAVSKLLIVTLSMGVLISPAMSQFSSGSTGADGELNVTEDTVLAVPPDGVFNFTTVTIAGNAKLSFQKNALNTPVYMLATGPITFGQGAVIDVNGSSGAAGLVGEGGPGGFSGGYPSISEQHEAGDGFGPGRGLKPHGRAAFGSVPSLAPRDEDGAVYGNALLVPMIGGSGGAGTVGNPGRGGDGGGGAILLASSVEINFTLPWGTIAASGGGHGGSGGAIRLVAPSVRGFGRLNATSGSGANGRVRIDSLNREGWNHDIRSRFSLGREMYVFPETLPELQITEVAGTSIPEGTGSSVEIVLPAGAPTTQSVKLRAKDFTGVITVEVVATPENGESTSQEIQIDMAGGDTAEATVSVEIPAGTTSHIHAWTK